MNNKFTYFPQSQDEIVPYVSALLEQQLEKDYEAEKLLLHAILNIMFEVEGNLDPCPNTVLFLLQNTAVADEQGYTLLDKIFISAQEKGNAGRYADVYWYLEEAGLLPDAAVRLISIYQFYDSLFPDPVFSEDGKTLLYYPKFCKNDTYNIPEGVEILGPHAICDNKYLKVIKIPSTVKKIGKTSILNLSGLKCIIVDGKNPLYFSEYGILYFGKNKNPTIVKYPCTLQANFFMVEDNIKKVKTFAFEKCHNLKEVSIMSSKTILEDGAFFYCDNVESITLLEGTIDDINKRAFTGMVLDTQKLGNKNDNEPANQMQDALDMDDIDEKQIKELSPEELLEVLKNKSLEHEKEQSNAEKLTPEIETNKLKVRTPSEIKKMFDDYIIGHEEAKRTLSVAVYSHILRCNNQNRGIGKSNIILCGPTGCGKTEFARTIAKCLDVPFVTADATSITEVGWKGNDPTDMLRDLIIAAGEDLEKAQKGIVYIDEIDKLAVFGENAHRESYSKGVQQGLLKIVEGGIVPIHIGNGTNEMVVNFDTSNVLFIAGGAFGSMTGQEENTTKSRPIGFGSAYENTEKKKTENKGKLEAKDFMKYGMTQEFIGRFPVIVQLQQLTEDDIYRIMVEPKNSVITQYKKLVSCIGPELEFDENLLRSIAKDAVKSGTGARGIRTIVEKLVEGVIFDLPDKKKVKKVKVKGNVEENKEEIEYIEENTETDSPPVSEPQQA